MIVRQYFQLVTAQTARELLDRRKNGGDGGREGLRVLKRRLSDVVYRAMLADQTDQPPVAA